MNQFLTSVDQRVNNLRNKSTVSYSSTTIMTRDIVLLSENRLSPAGKKRL